MYDKSLTHNVKKTYIIAVAAIILTAATACRPDKNKHQEQQTATAAQTEQKQDGGEDSLTISFTMTDINGKEINVTDEFARHKITIVDFWASWCGPCRMVGPIVDEIAGERPDIKVGKVNVDEQQELAAAFQILSIPTLLVMRQGKVVSQTMGARPKQQILALLSEAQGG